MADIIFDYFTAAEADQYTFYRIPKALFTERHFQGLSCEAKLLYGMMLDRMGLSIRNQWFDSMGRAYIIFTVEDVMGVMGCQSQKAVRLMKELDTVDGIGLIEKKRIGLGKPNLIYVKNFMARGNADTGTQAGSGRKEAGVPCSAVSLEKGHVQTGADGCGTAGQAGYSWTDDGCMDRAAAGGMAGTENCACREENWWNHAPDAGNDGRTQNVGAEMWRSMETGVMGQAGFIDNGMDADVENVDNVDSVDKSGQTMVENQNPDDFTYSLPDPSTAGYGYGCTDGCFLPERTAGVPETAPSAAGKAGDAAPERGKFAYETVEAMMREILGRGEMPEYGGSEQESEYSAGQEFQEAQGMEFEKRNPIPVHSETPELWNAQRNNTEYSNTENTETEYNEKEKNKSDFSAVHQFYQSYQSHQAFQPGRTDKDMDLDAGTDSITGKMDAYREAIRENIDYQCFSQQETEDVDELVELMVDTMMVPDRQGIRIAGSEKPAAVVKSRFMKIVHSHIEYVMGCLQKHTGKIWNIKAYLMTALYNSSLTISSYYHAEVKGERKSRFLGALH